MFSIIIKTIARYAAPALFLISAACFFVAGMPLVSMVNSTIAMVMIVAISLKK